MSLLLWCSIGALLLLAVGLIRRSNELTAAGLAGMVLVALAGVPLFVRAVAIRQDNTIAALIGVDAAAAIAVATLILWRISRRYPLFNVCAALAVGTAASALLASA